MRCVDSDNALDFGLGPMDEIDSKDGFGSRANDFYNNTGSISN